jgi:putative ABC transport system ATP-binding protein
MANPTILKVEQLTKIYPSGMHQLAVLSDVSFSLDSGSSAAIVGPSGSGKTTLLGLCAGLDRPTSGRVFVDDVDLGDLDEDARARVRRESIGFVFQNFQLMSTLTALENVMVPSELRGDTGVSKRAAELLGRVGLGDRLDHFPVQLSGGEQQRVALARAFINQPKLLFADEPTGNLDAETAAIIVDLVFALNREAGTTLVLVTHDPDLAARTEQVIRLRGGRVVSEVSR